MYDMPGQRGRLASQGGLPRLIAQLVYGIGERRIERNRGRRLAVSKLELAQ
jgi:hypothetical protein